MKTIEELAQQILNENYPGMPAVNDTDDWELEEILKELAGDVKKVVEPKLAFTPKEVDAINRLKAMAESQFFNLKNRLPIGFDLGKVVIAGGCFVDWFHGTKPKDIDVFVFGNPDYVEMLRLTVENHMGAGSEVERSQYRLNNDNIIAVYNDVDKPFQYIFTKYATREEMLKHFDYAHCMVSYDGDKLYISRQTYNALSQKMLIVNNKDRITDWRTQKFLSRGFTKYIDPNAAPMYTGPVVASTATWASTGARINPINKARFGSSLTP